jgi:hypothetical protein
VGGIDEVHYALGNPAGCPGLIQEFFEKKKKRVLGFKFLGFLGDGFGVKEKKKGRHGRIVSDRHRHPLGGMGLE